MKPSVAKAIKAVTHWNLDHKIGTKVRVFKTIRRDAEDLKCETSTRTDAFISDAGTPVVFLEGISGYWSLDAVEAVQ